MNISKPIKISYTWDKDNFEKVYSATYSHQYRNSLRRYIGWLFIAMLQFGVVAALKGGSIGLLLFSTVLLVYWYGIKPWLIYHRAKKEFEKSELKDKIIVLNVTDQGIEQDNNLITWDEIEAVVPTDDDLVLYQDNNAFYLPQNAFSSIEDKSIFKTIAKKKGKLYV